MKKLLFIFLLILLIVMPVSAQKKSFQQIMDDSGITEGSDTSWLTKRWTDALGNCLIKGNISYKSKDKIYHIPGWKDYEATKINTNYGERWFCTEWEAYKAGWRAPYYIDRPKVYPNP